MSKTSTLFTQYFTLLKEQGEDPNATTPPMEGGDINATAPQEDPNAAPIPQPEDNPITSNEEDILISKIVDGALFSPSVDQEKELKNLRLLVRANAHRNITDQMIQRVCQIIGSPINPYQSNQLPPKEGETLPLTQEKKEILLANLLDAALYKPSHAEANTLNKFKEVMETGKFENSNEEVLTSVLNFIKPATDDDDLRQTMDQLDK